MISSSRVAVTGCGFTTSIGNHQSEVMRSLLELKTGIEAWSPVEGEKRLVKLAGTLKGFDCTSSNPAAWIFPDDYQFDPRLARSMPPQGLYALSALEEALQEAGLDSTELNNDRTGLYCASAGSPKMMHQHLTRLEESDWIRPHPHGIISSVAGALHFHLAAHLEVKGSCCGFTSACSSGSHALGFAFDEIRLGRQDRMIVVAAEDLSPENVIPFAGMGALSQEDEPSRASCPFDENRNGFVATGGAVVMILEHPEHALARGARPLAMMQGWGQASDGHHVAQPQPDGEGLQRAMNLALKDGKLSPQDISAVNAHAPSTPAGDRAEALALSKFFSSSQPAISSTKALTGHGLTLAGLMEAAFCVLSLKEQFVPGQAHLRNKDEACADLFIPTETLKQPVHAILNNSSGFGGTNVAHLFTHYNYD